MHAVFSQTRKRTIVAIVDQVPRAQNMKKIDSLLVSFQQITWREIVMLSHLTGPCSCNFPHRKSRMHAVFSQTRKQTIVAIVDQVPRAQNMKKFDSLLVSFQQITWREIVMLSHLTVSTVCQETQLCIHLRRNIAPSKNTAITS